MYEISRQYRTKMSLNDEEVSVIKTHVEKENVQTFIDFGCHAGHLTIELALSYSMDIVAVDSFKTIAGILDEAHPDSGFFDTTANNIKEVEKQFLGSVRLLSDFEFFAAPMKDLDMAFIDASHTLQDVWQFEAVEKMVKPGGIVAGHDWSLTCIGVSTGIKTLLDKNCSLLKRHGPMWFLRKSK